MKLNSRDIGVLRFPGTNCDQDVWRALESQDLRPHWLWHADRFNPIDFGGFVLPGGFSYGDYLRCGVLACKAPVMDSLREAAAKGFPILGICNGFQILCESGLLPGVLLRNSNRRFIDRWVNLKCLNPAAWGGQTVSDGETVRMPIAHGEGRFFMPNPDDVKGLFERQQVWWTYGENPNGSMSDIAGVCSRERNVCGLMPHPERHVFMDG